MKKRIFSLVLFSIVTMALMGLWGVALAQEAGAVTFDIPSWFVSTASLAAVIIAATAFVRKHLWASLDGFYVVLFNIVLGAALGILGHVLGYLDGGLIQALLFGGGAGLAAAGGVDGLRAILGTGSLQAIELEADVAEANSTRVAADRARLRH